MLTTASVSRVIVFALVNCQTRAALPAMKLARFTVRGVLSGRYLLSTITVIALSLERWAAKAATLSGLATVAETLVSPNVLLSPS